MLINTLLVLAACVRPATNWPPPVSSGELAQPAGLEAHLIALQEEIDEASAAKDVERVVSLFSVEPDAVRDWAEAVLPSSKDPVVFSYDIKYPANRGAIVALTLSTTGSRMTLRAYAVSGQDGWKLQSLESLNAGQQPTLQALEAEVEINPASEWLKAQVTTKVSTAGWHYVPFDFAGRTPGNAGGYRVSEVLLDGVPTLHHVSNEKLVVKVGSSKEAVVTVRYEGAPARGGSYITTDDLFLRRSSGWIPTLDAKPAELTLHITHPTSIELLGQGVERETTQVDDERRRTTWTFKDTDFSLYGAPSYVRSEVRAGGTTVTIALWPRDATHTESAIDVVERAMKGLGELGPYPAPSVNIVESGFAGGGGGAGDFTNLAIGYRTLPIDLNFITHELAHGWFPGVVPATKDVRGAWPESMAEYMSSWALDPAAAVELRQSWAANYAALPDAKDQAIAETSWSAGWQVHKAVSYDKGALALTHLEHQIGREGMIALLNRFLDERRGKPSRWQDFLDVLASAHPEATNSFKSWIERVGAPDLAIVDAEITPGGLKATLMQTSKPPFSGEVEIVFMSDTDELSVEIVSFDQARTTMELSIPEGATRAVLDGHHRIPRRYDVDADPVEAGLALRLTP